MNYLIPKDPVTRFSLMSDGQKRVFKEIRVHYFDHETYPCESNCSFCSLYKTDWETMRAYKPIMKYCYLVYNLDLEKECILVIGKAMHSKIIEYNGRLWGKELNINRIEEKEFTTYDFRVRGRIKKIPQESSLNLDEAKLDCGKPPPYDELAKLHLSFMGEKSENRDN